MKYYRNSTCCRMEIPETADYRLEILAISMEKLHYINSKGY